MTSSCSFRKLLAENMRRRTWLILLSVYLYVTYILDFTLSQSRQVLVFGSDKLGPGNKTVFLFTVLLAILSALQGFYFLFSEEKTDFYFSLPIKRSRLFLSIYVNGLLISIVPCILSRLTCYFIEGSRTRETLCDAWMGILINTAGFLLIYHLALLVMVLTGNLLLALAGMGLMFCYSSLAFGLVFQRYSSAFFHTYFKMDLMNALALYLSPYSLYLSLTGADKIGDAKAWSLQAHLPQAAAVLFFAALGFALVYILFNRRPAEAAGRSLAFTKSGTAIKFILAVPLVLMAGYYVMLCSLNGRSLVLLGFGILLASFTVNGLLESVFRLDIRGFQKKKREFLYLALICMGISACFYFDVWGYDNYLPRAKDVKSAAVAVYGLNQAPDDDMDLTPSAIEPILENMTLTGSDKKQLLKWLKDVRQSPAHTGVPLTYAVAAFRLSGHKTVYRKYPVRYASRLDAFAEIYKTQAYKEGVLPILSEKSPGRRTFYWSNGIQGYHLDLTDDENKFLLSCLAKDYMNLTMKDVKQEFPIGSLALVYQDSTNGEQAYIYPSFTHTLKALKQWEIPALKGAKDYDIKEIRLFEKHRKTSPFGKVTLSLSLVSDIKEKSGIDKLSPFLIPGGYNVNPLLRPAADKYQATVSLRDSSGKTLSYAAMTLKSKEALKAVSTPAK